MPVIQPQALPARFRLVPIAASNYRGGRSEVVIGRALQALLAGSRDADFYRHIDWPPPPFHYFHNNNLRQQQQQVGHIEKGDGYFSRWR